jgi:hypothetical protein
MWRYSEPRRHSSANERARTPPIVESRSVVLDLPIVLDNPQGRVLRIDVSPGEVISQVDCVVTFGASRNRLPSSGRLVPRQADFQSWPGRTCTSTGIGISSVEAALTRATWRQLAQVAIPGTKQLGPSRGCARSGSSCPTLTSCCSARRQGRPNIASSTRLVRLNRRTATMRSQPGE